MEKIRKYQDSWYSFITMTYKISKILFLVITKYLYLMEVFKLDSSWTLVLFNDDDENDKCNNDFFYAGVFLCGIFISSGMWNIYSSHGDYFLMN